MERKIAKKGIYGLEKAEIIDFVSNLKATDHAILFYADPKDKRYVLFTYLRAGLEKGEAAVYVASQESPKQIKQFMREFGIDVERYEKIDALRVINYRDFYIIDGKFDMSKTIGLMKNLLDEAKAKGFKGLRGAGEMTCFFKHGMVKELVKYEQTLHQTLEIPLTVLCAYNFDLVAKGRLLLGLISAHSVVIIGSKAGLVKIDPMK